MISACHRKNRLMKSFIVALVLIIPTASYDESLTSPSHGFL